MRIFNPTTSSGGGGETGATGATGPLPWEFMGAYDNGYSYPLNKAVTYLGGYYYRTGNPLNPGYPPTPGAINASWTPVADKGEQGATGPQGLQGPGGGGGAGGLMFYLNQNTAPDSTTGLPTISSVVTGFAVKELGRIADTVQTTVTTQNLPTEYFNLVAGFVSDVQDPNITTIPPGLWDLNFWASSTANTNKQTVVQVKAYVYNGATLGEPFATSDELYIYDPAVVAQYTANLVVGSGVTITASDRIYIEIWAKGSSNNYTLTLKFGAGTPTHLHTTIPSVSGTGVVKVEDGIFKTPASLIVDADIATNAAISLSKISGLTPQGIGAFSTADVIGLTKGGTGAITQETARIAMGGFQQVDWAITGTITGTMNTLVTPNTFTYGTSTTLTIDSGTPSLGDTVYVSGQSSTSTPNGAANGPWVITQAGITGVQPTILTRPTWFSGTAKNNMICVVKYGNSNAGIVRSTIGTVSTTKTDISVGTTVLSGVVLVGRSSNASLAGNTYTGRQTLAANTTTVNPFSFQSSTTMLTSLVAHAVEWDSNLMYITPASIATANLKRGINASYIPALTSADVLTLGTAQSTVQLNALTSASAGVLGQTILDTVNDALYICTSTGPAGAAKWKKVALSTF